MELNYNTKLSVIIAIYNAEHFLKACLESIKFCPLENIECIMINDGSTDSSVKICEEFALVDDRFKLICKDNSGVSDSRNIGIDEAQGEYILFLDADDYINMEMWPQIIEHINQGKYDLVSYAYYSFFESGKVEAELYPAYADKAENDINDLSHALLCTTLLNTCWGKLLRRNIIEKHCIRFRKDLKTCEDAIFMVDFAQNSSNFTLLNICVLYYRIHKNSTMRTINISNKLKDYNELFIRRNEYLAINFNNAIRTDMYRQCFSVITDLFRAYAFKQSINSSKNAYIESAKTQVYQDIMAGVDKKSLTAFYKKIEYFLMQKKYFTCLAIYFKFKSQFNK